ncbi:MAG: helix-turn-helix domain-containing protein [Actinomycetota bacterium]|nr:helix-turn-helix domain-containing protein [Actinomycetota bacterium]
MSNYPDRAAAWARLAGERRRGRMGRHSWREIKAGRADTAERRSGYLDAVADEELGQRLRELRLQAGLTQAELAARVGISQPNVARLESGINPPNLSTLRKIADALSADVVVAFEKRATTSGSGNPP